MTRGNTVAIIQARMGSTRLPGKVLKRLGAHTMLAYLVDRVSCARTLDGIVLATTTEEADDVIVCEGMKLGVPIFRGSETDVLERYVKAARAFRAGIVVRVTADNPFTDPQSIDRAVEQIRAGYDYALEVGMPIGTTGEALTFTALDFIDRVADTLSWREHVTLYAKENPHLFRCSMFKAPAGLDRPDLSFTVDRPEDYAWVSRLERYLPSPHFPLQKLLALADMRGDRGINHDSCKEDQPAGNYRELRTHRDDRVQPARRYVADHRRQSHR
jgi:spore coat polysaccharide biosynthesis protein SpsF